MIHPTASPFTDPAAVARYAEGPRRNVPGYDSLLPMVRILLAERVPADGRVLVVVAHRGTRSHLYVYDREGEGWRERGRVPARDDVFQVGPRLSPDAKRLLFAQADGERSGEFFLVELQAGADARWPPSCAD